MIYTASSSTVRTIKATVQAVVYWGEGWHNNHHHNPKRATFGERWWEIDVSGWIIRLVKKS